ncbi:hypothetical protein CesoFtcFv8_009889 [Champsocephalus esox]|uniref:Uncharacterized protein n=2 Tax=Champsocephalus TaxID=52236 RepID=A0AAN8HQC3_CHAGU|nr:hypothetical protein CesoFtcFv8_009889 [Champsocephalus esox]KAK5924784.1 hypothetical protein CgunFtcFv8_017368 [Champsocephalus gunnari]
MLDYSLRGAQLSLKSFPPVLVPGHIPAVKAVKSFCYIRRHDAAPPHSSAISPGCLQSPALFTQFFLPATFTCD